MLEQFSNWFQSRQFRMGFKFICLLFSIIVLYFSFKRDWNLDKQRFPIDLRNRVLGARLLGTGHSPYFYKWQNGDPVIWYDLAHFREIKTSAVTVPPFFLMLMKPLSYLSYDRISIIWLIIEYGILLFVLYLTYLKLKNDIHRGLLFLSLSVFTLSNTWQNHTDLGQYYLFIAFLIFMIYYLIYFYYEKWNFMLLAAFLSFVLVACRPLGLLAILPLLFQCGRLKVYFISGLLMSATYLLSLIFIPSQIKLWVDYQNAVKIMTRFHLHQIQPDFNFKPYTEPAFVEGYNMRQLDKIQYVKSYKEYCVNYYKLPEELGFRRFTIKETAIHFTLLFMIVFLLAWLALKKLKHHWNRVELLLCLGLFIYIGGEIFYPVNRATYNEVQWLPFFAFVFLFQSKRDLMIGLSFVVMFLFTFNINHFQSQIIVSELTGLLFLFGFILVSFLEKRKGN